MGDIDDNEDPKPKNLIILFGCWSGKTVEGNSTLTPALLSKLSSIVKADNSLVLPGELISWVVPGQGEILPLAASEI